MLFGEGAFLRTMTAMVGPPLAPLVVGYKGEIGRYILAGLLEDLPKANDIYCVDVSNSEADVRERIARTDFVFLCIPLQHTLEWLRLYHDALIGKVIVEQCSLKAMVYEASDLADLNFLGMHVLFRPSATQESDRRCLVFADHWTPSDLAAFASEMGRTLKTRVECLTGSDEPAYRVHDRLMARQQALVHRVVLILARGLSDEASRTYIGQRICELGARIQAGDPTLYEIIQSNPFLAEEVAGFEADLRGFTA